MKKTVDEFFRELFDPKTMRQKRSQAYKDGVRAGIKFIFEGVSLLGACPFEDGTAQSDAWFSGIEEGKTRAQREIEKCCDEHEDCRNGTADPCCNDRCDNCERK